MEIRKQRPVPISLKYMRSLNTRSKLTDKERLYYSNLEKGYAGELTFDQLLLKNLSLNCLILNDLLLEANNTEFQNDTFLISQNTLYLFDVKNFEGDFFIEDNKWYTFPKNDRKNPMLQLERSETAIRQLIRELGFKITVKPYLIFVNPEFHLYHSTPNLPIIHPTQLNRFINKLNKTPSSLHEMHYDLAEQLISLHQPVSKNMKIPAFSYQTIDKGMMCGRCFSLETVVIENKFICRKCGCIEVVDNAVLRNVEELRFLFPELRITTKLVHEWCGMGLSKKTIRRLLAKKYNLVLFGPSSYYI
ncbi:NERD domain-containing protein [Bacillus sp. DNRA2]|uniref:nuclease-related domain-containing protein n=1 Tax=Bacillus sp. DNRA2 TaxID=2723053 RepID=UPI00145F0BCC|nr:nuclease-related domain-containing protein [Bacillus sp. DNRA2]NMD70711.1 NERD domain-containing protein [Bacillus sp. DNRA2]